MEGFANTINTSEFQKIPNYFFSEEDCKETKKVNTNPRYPMFKQTHFTCGDENQFEMFRDATNNNICMENINLDNNVYKNKKLFRNWGGYKNITAVSVDNTFKYLFHKFKKSIFVKIKNNKLSVFLPFSKSKYVNEWSDRIKVSDEFNNDHYTLLKHIASINNKPFNKRYVNKYIKNWYANNCLLRNEFPISEGDSGAPQMCDMLNELCNTREVPDMEFFINRRDFPLLKRDKTEPYNHIYDSEDYPLVSHNYDKYSPILSNVTSENYADIPIPTWDDWSRVRNFEGKFFKKDCRNYTEDFDIPWEDKKPTAVFRGASTGCGVTIDTNPRLKLANLSLITPPDDDGIPLIDAGITKWQLRPRKIMGIQELQIIRKNELPFGLIDKLTPKQQSEYKYVINVDGHVSAFRLSLELSMGSVILLAESKWKLWFRKFLKPYKHYIPINEDLTDLVEKIKWCKNNDSECKKIAMNAKKFYNKYLTKNGILDYLQKLLLDIKKVNGIYLYNYISPLKNQINIQKKYIIDKYYPNTDKNIEDINIYPTYKGRSYDVLKALEWIINMLGDKLYMSIQKHKSITYNSKTEINEYVLANFPIIIKSITSKNKYKKYENINEIFIGTKCINNLLQQIPNFAYILGCDNTTKGHYNPIVEKIEGETLHNYIKSDYFNMKDFIFILLQIACALQVAQNQYGFIHWDLVPNNIIINKINRPVTFDYVISYNKVIRINTNIIPIIIDYGKSHVVYNSRHYGLCNMFKMSTIQDIISILISSAYTILINKYLKKNELNILINICNFLAGNNFRQQKFKNRQSLLNFLNYNHRFSILISSDKSELENKSPIDFINYVLNETKNIYDFSLYNVLDNQYLLGNGNPKQVFDYILSSNNEEKLNSYTQVFERLLKCTIPKYKDIFFIYYILQTFEINLSNVYHSMNYFLEIEDINKEKYISIYNNCMNFIHTYYTQELQYLEKQKIEYEFNTNNNTIHYDSNTFLLPDEISSKINSITSFEHDITEYKDIIQNVLLNNRTYKLPNHLKEYYINNFDQILNKDNVHIKNYVANINTLVLTTYDIYLKNYNMLSVIIQEELQQNKNCEESIKKMKMYKNILDVIDNISL